MKTTFSLQTFMSQCVSIASVCSNCNSVHIAILLLNIFEFSRLKFMDMYQKSKYPKMSQHVPTCPRCALSMKTTLSLQTFVSQCDSIASVCSRCTYSYFRLIKFRLVWRCKSVFRIQSKVSDCIRLLQIAPDCTKLHQIVSDRTRLHQIASDCTSLHQIAFLLVPPYRSCRYHSFLLRKCSNVNLCFEA